MHSSGIKSAKKANLGKKLCSVMLLLFRLHQALKKSKSFFEIPIFKQRPEGACCGI